MFENRFLPGAEDQLNRGLAAYQAGDYQPALKHLEQALALFRRGFPYEEQAVFPVIYTYLGRASLHLGDAQTAHDCGGHTWYLLNRLHGERLTDDHASCLNDLGSAALALGSFDETVWHHTRALHVLVLLSRGGGTHQALDQGSPSRAEIRQTLARATDAYLKNSAANTCGYLGNLYQVSGRHREAIDWLELAEAMLEGCGDDQSQYLRAALMSKLGFSLQRANNPKKALERYQQACALLQPYASAAARAAHDLLSNRLNLAVAWFNCGDRDRAVAALEALSADPQAMAWPDLAAWTQANLAMIKYRPLGAHREAFQCLLQARDSLHQYAGNTPRLIELDQSLALIAGEAGDHDTSLAINIGNLAHLMVLGNRDALWQVCEGIAHALMKKGETDAAVFLQKLAVNTLQTARASLADLGRDLSQLMPGSGPQACYTILADWLAEAGRFAEAREVLGLRDIRETVAVEHLRAELNFQSRLSAVEAECLLAYFNLLDTFARQGQADPAGVERWLQATVRAFQRSQNNHLDSIRQVNRQLAQELARRLPQDQPGLAVLHFIPAADHLRILVTLPGTAEPRQVRHPLNETYLHHCLYNLLRDLTDPDSDPVPSARAAYHELLAPVRRYLDEADSRVDTLLIAVTGSLRAVPFAALHDGEGYLIKRYKIIYLRETSRVDLTRQPAMPARLAAFGCTTRAPGLDALAYVSQELGAVTEVAQVVCRTETPRLDAAFTRQALTTAIERGATILHIASHFLVNPAYAPESQLLLGTHERFSLAEFQTLNLRNVDLLVLSACDTATPAGKPDPSEAPALDVALSAAGARAVLATLWPVNDSSTQKLAAEFYRGLFEPAYLDKAAALRQAQLALLYGSEGSTNRTRGTRMMGFGQGVEEDLQQQDYSHPYFWGAFILAGNWQPFRRDHTNL